MYSLIFAVESYHVKYEYQDESTHRCNSGVIIITCHASTQVHCKMCPVELVRITSARVRMIYLRKELQ